MNTKEAGESKMNRGKKIGYWIFGSFLVLSLIAVMIPLFFSAQRYAMTSVLKKLKTFTDAMSVYEKEQVKPIYPLNIDFLGEAYTFFPSKGGYRYRYYVSENRYHFIYAAFPTSPSNGWNIIWVDEARNFFKTPLIELWNNVNGYDGRYPDLFEIDWTQKGMERIPELEWSRIELSKWKKTTFSPTSDWLKDHDLRQKNIIRETVPDLIVLLKDARAVMRVRASCVLGKIGPAAKDAIPDLVLALKDSYACVRRSAAKALGQMGPAAKDAVPALLLALKDSHACVYRSAAKALFVIDAEALFPALQDTDVKVRWHAAEVLGKMGPPAQEVVPALLLALKDSQACVRMHAAEALGKIGPQAKEAVALLTLALQDIDLQVHWYAAEALVKIGPTIPALILALQDSYERVRENASEVLAKMGPEAKEAIPALILALEDTDEIVARNAAEALGNIEAKEAIPALILALKEDKLVRISAAKALGRMGLAAKEAIPALILTLQDSDFWYVDARSNAAEALGQMGPAAKEAIPALISALKDRTETVRVKAAEALGRMGSEAREAISALLLALKDPEETVRAKAAEALAKIDSSIKIPQ